MTEEEYIPSSADTVDEDLARMSEQDHEARTEAYLAGLQQYDLEDDDHLVWQASTMLNSTKNAHLFLPS